MTRTDPAGCAGSTGRAAGRGGGTVVLRRTPAPAFPSPAATSTAASVPSLLSLSPPRTFLSLSAGVRARRLTSPAPFALSKAEGIPAPLVPWPRAQLSSQLLPRYLLCAKTRSPVPAGAAPVTPFWGCTPSRGNGPRPAGGHSASAEGQSGARGKAGAAPPLTGSLVSVG